jgi:hypothetical protein
MHEKVSRHLAPFVVGLRITEVRGRPTIDIGLSHGR